MIPDKLRDRVEVLQLFWQMGGLPVAGQNHHFVAMLQKKDPYAVDRYVNETRTLVRAVLESAVERS